MGYRIARALIKIFLAVFTHLEVQGEQNLPPSGSFIIAANHLGRLDVPLVYYFLDRSDVILMVAEKYRKIPLARWFLKQLNGIWVDRFNADFGALRKALNRLRQGGVLVLAPEGTRSPTGALIQARPGTGYLAAKAGVPILPVALTGTEDQAAIHQLTHLRRPHIKIRVGEVFRLPEFDARSSHREADLEQFTDEIMCRIAALLPSEYRGFYADHPRLKTLLSGTAPHE